MLIQYIATADSADSLRSQARAALDAGISWLELKASSSVSDADITAIVNDLREELAEKNCVLIVADRYELAEEIKADGVHIYSRATPISAVRAKMQAWPIIGVSVENADDASSLRGHDIDYLFLSPVFGADEKGLQPVSDIAALLEKNDSETPLVSGGGITADNAERVVEAGASSLAIDASISAGTENLKDAIAVFLSKFA